MILRMQDNYRRFATVNNRASLNIRRAEAREKIFRQMKQDSARVVDPTRRNFVKYDGKDSVEISCDEFLEMPNNNVVHILPYGELPSDVAVDGYYVSAYDYHNNESIIDYILNFYELTPAYYSNG